MDAAEFQGEQVMAPRQRWCWLPTGAAEVRGAQARAAGSSREGCRMSARSSLLDKLS